MSDFGEPWGILRLTQNEMRDRSGTLLAHCQRNWSRVTARLERATACVNALAGVADPAAFVERAKAIEIAFRKFSPGAMEGFNETSPDEIAALAAEWTEDA